MILKYSQQAQGVKMGIVVPALIRRHYAEPTLILSESICSYYYAIVPSVPTGPDSKKIPIIIY